MVLSQLRSTFGMAVKQKCGQTLNNAGCTSNMNELGEELQLDLPGKAECGGSQGQGWSLVTPPQRRLLQLLVTSIEIPNPAPIPYP